LLSYVPVQNAENRSILSRLGFGQH
jgi:hypothetical protein